MIPFYGNHDEEISLFEEIELNVSSALNGDYIQVWIYIYVYIYIYIYTHTHTYIYIYIYREGRMCG